MARKSLIGRVFYLARDVMWRRMYPVLRTYSHGHVLDVGGWDFFLTAKRKGVPFSRWTTLEPDADKLMESFDPRAEVVQGDGCAMPFEDESFDTVLNLQVLEHVFEPLRMVAEIRRVLKPGGHAVFLIPQSNTIHLEPHHYYNFTRFWVKKAMETNGFETIRLEPLGGFFNSEASRLLHFVVQSLTRRLKSPTGDRRPLPFYGLYPFMVVSALAILPLFLLFGLADLREEANNHLCVVRKPSARN